MKKNLILVLLLFAWLLPTAVLAGTKVGTPKCWTVPAVFTGDEEVSFYYDVTDVGFPEGVDLYLWAWQPSEPDKGNGDNSSDFAKLEYLGNNIYRKTMIPTKYFNVKASAFEDANWPGFWQQLKTKRDDLWSTEFAAPDSRAEFQNFKESGAGFRFFSGKKSPGFTEKFTIDEPLTVVFNPDVYKLGGRTLADVAKDANFVQFGVHSGLNDNWEIKQTLDVWRPACLAKAGLKKLSNGLYVWNVGRPSEYYASNPDDAGRTTPTKLADPDFKVAFQLDEMNYLVVEVIRSDKGTNEWGLNSGDQKQKAGTAVPYPDPVFSLFPTHVSAKDILTLTREYNERTSGDLQYTITAGKTSFKGIMTGVRDKRKATVNLAKELQGTEATELHIVVKKGNGQTVADVTVPLLTPEK